MKDYMRASDDCRLRVLEAPDDAGRCPAILTDSRGKKWWRMLSLSTLDEQWELVPPVTERPHGNQPEPSVYAREASKLSRQELEAIVADLYVCLSFGSVTNQPYPPQWRSLRALPERGLFKHTRG